MNTSTVEPEIIELLDIFGFKRVEAHILVYLLVYQKGTSRMIEREMKLRQPEVSLGTSNLVTKNIITMRELPIDHKGKGRPMVEYMLNGSRTETVKRIVQDALEAIEMKKQKIGGLERLLENLPKGNQS